MNIKIFYDGTTFRIKSWRKIKALIVKVISKEQKISGDLNFILTNDDVLIEINKKFLQHNYYTDVIAFDYGDGRLVSGEIYISLDTVRLNAKNYNISYKDELLRVIIHGLLHLCGYRDKGIDEKEKMKKQEDFWMSIYEEM